MWEMLYLFLFIFSFSIKIENIVYGDDEFDRVCEW